MKYKSIIYSSLLFLYFLSAFATAFSFLDQSSCNIKEKKYEWATLKNRHGLTFPTPYSPLLMSLLFKNNSFHTQNTHQIISCIRFLYQVGNYFFSNIHCNHIRIGLNKEGQKRPIDSSTIFSTKKSTKKARIESNTENTKDLNNNKLAYKALCKAPEKRLEILETHLNRRYILWKNVCTDDIPEKFPSVWVWNVIGWIDAAYKQISHKGELYSTLDQLLTAYDPLLPFVVRGTLKVFFRHDVDVTARNLTKNWIDYIEAQTGYSYHWRQWLLVGSDEEAQTEVVEFTNLYADGLATDTCKAEFKEYKINLNEISKNKKPNYFKSNSMWVLICIINRDPALVSSLKKNKIERFYDNNYDTFVKAILYEIYSSPSVSRQDKLVITALLDNTFINAIFDWRSTIRKTYTHPREFMCGEPQYSDIEESDTEESDADSDDEMDD